MIFGVYKDFVVASVPAFHGDSTWIAAEFDSMEAAVAAAVEMNRERLWVEPMPLYEFLKRKEWLNRAYRRPDFLLISTP